MDTLIILFLLATGLVCFWFFFRATDSAETL